MRNQTKRDTKRADNVKDTALLMGVSTRQVQLVLAGDRQNEKIIEVFMELSERKNILLEEVKKLVPFN